jgi:hypothetical protein
MKEELVREALKKNTPGEEVVLARGRWQGFKYIHETEPVFILRAAQAGFSEPGPYGLLKLPAASCRECARCSSSDICGNLI